MKDNEFALFNCALEMRKMISQDSRFSSLTLETNFEFIEYEEYRLVGSLSGISIKMYIFDGCDGIYNVILEDYEKVLQHFAINHCGLTAIEFEEAIQHGHEGFNLSNNGIVRLGMKVWDDKDINKEVIRVLNKLFEITMSIVYESRIEEEN